MDEINSLILLLVSGLLLRYSLIYAGQSWAKSHSQTVAFLILPVITYVITKTIAGNIALSLGMIGALSIVRFRHPVKSALELIMYFDLITIGIATSVRTKWAIQLVLVSVIVIILVKVIHNISKKFGKSFYSISFNEGIDTNTLEIITNKRVEIIEKNEQLVNYSSDTVESKYVYRLNFNNRKALEEFKNKLNADKDIQKINIVFN
tara:strand:- start:938 stop:1555 length:618 start_codon:yes stop_codon:yes gene_type:complete